MPVRPCGAKQSYLRRKALQAKIAAQRLISRGKAGAGRAGRRSTRLQLAGKGARNEKKTRVQQHLT